jgi:hypothetical protein
MKDIIELTSTQFKSTFVGKMRDLTKTAGAVVDIWNYVKRLTDNNIVSKYVFEKQLIEYVYRNENDSFDHVLLPTSNENTFVVIVVDIKKKAIFGYFRLDLNKEYGLN